MRNKPCEKLQYNDHGEHGDNRETAPPEDEECENTGNHRDDDGEPQGNGGEKRCVLEILLRNVLVANEATCAGSVVDEILDQRENAAEQVNGCVCDRSVASVLHTFV